MAPKRRSIDLQEVEARVTTLDKSKRRSYDIYDIEQRVYDLEAAGSSPTPGGATEIVKRYSTDSTEGSYTASKDMDMKIVLSSNNYATYALTINNVSISDTLTTNAEVSTSAFAVSSFSIKKDDVLVWAVTNSARAFVAFDMGEVTS